MDDWKLYEDEYYTDDVYEEDMQAETIQKLMESNAKRTEDAVYGCSSALRDKFVTAVHNLAKLQQYYLDMIKVHDEANFQDSIFKERSANQWKELTIRDLVKEKLTLNGNLSIKQIIKKFSDKETKQIKKTYGRRIESSVTNEVKAMYNEGIIVMGEKGKWEYPEESQLKELRKVASLWNSCRYDDDQPVFTKSEQDLQQEQLNTVDKIVTDKDFEVNYGPTKVVPLITAQGFKIFR